MALREGPCFYETPTCWRVLHKEILCRNLWKSNERFSFWCCVLDW